MSSLCMTACDGGDPASPVTVAPSIDVEASTVPNAVDGSTYFARVRTNGTPPFTYEVTTGDLPSGIVLVTGTGDLTGTPTETGEFTFDVTATNPAGADTQSFTIDVTPAADPLPEITTTTLADATVGIVYDAAIATTGSTPQTFSITGGTLPDGLAIDPDTGRIQGTPTMVEDRTFTVLATNAHGTDTQALAITVLAAPTAPTITTPMIGALDPVRLLTPFEVQCEASGTAPITWSTEGATPPGIGIGSSTGLLGGASFSTGSFSFDVVATNSAGSDSLTVTLEVVQTPTISSLLVESGVPGSTLTIVGSGFDPVAADNTVEFDGVAARVLGVTLFTLDIEVPSGTVDDQVEITIEVDGQTSDPAAFTIDRTPVLFVDRDAVGSNDGSTWTDAFTDLQSALAVATSGTQVRIAQGTYSPGSDPTDSFVPPDGVLLLGGYQGVTGIGNDRDVLAHRTVLDGDVLGDDSGTSGRADNNQHVVHAQSDGSLHLDGLTIRGGQTPSVGNRSGAGVLAVTSKTVTLIDCRIESNIATGNGGGLYLDSGSDEPSRIVDCVFEDNRSDMTGGALWGNLDDLELTRVVFSGNSADQSGGVHITGNGLELSDVLMVGNSATASTSAMRLGCQNATLRHLTMTANSGPVAALRTTASGIRIFNSVIAVNVGAAENAQLSTGVAGLELSHVLLEGGTAGIAGQGHGATTQLLDQAPVFFNAADPDGADNLWATNDDGLRAASGSPLLDSGAASQFSPLDLTHRMRASGTAPDLGAYAGAGV